MPTSCLRPLPLALCNLLQLHAEVLLPKLKKGLSTIRGKGLASNSGKQEVYSLKRDKQTQRGSLNGLLS